MCIRDSSRLSPAEQRVAYRDEMAKHRGRFSARIQEGGLIVESENVTRVTLYGHPDLLPFGSPIEVSLSGGKTKKVRFKRSLKILLDQIEKTNDRSRIPWGSVSLRL